MINLSYMKQFEFTIKIFLGQHCNGACEYAEGKGSVELEDSQVDQLVALIKEHNGETNVEALGLEEKYPEIYKTLDEASYDAASEANYRHWLIEGYLCGYFEPESGKRPRKIKNFKSLSEDEKVAYIEENYGDVMDQGEPGDFEYAPVIPEGIVELAGK